MVKLHLAMLDIKVRIERQDGIFIRRENDDPGEQHHLLRCEMASDDVGDVLEASVSKIGPRSRNYEVPPVMEILSFEQREEVQKPFLFRDVRFNKTHLLS